MSVILIWNLAYCSLISFGSCCKMELTVKEMNSLTNILEDSGLGQRTFENVAASFHHCFNKREHFRIGSALILFLQQEDLLSTREQRLMSVYLLYEMYRTEPIEANPFASVFVHLLHPPDEMKGENGEFVKRPWALPRLSSSEKHFLSQLISMPTKDLFKKTPNQIIQMDVSNLQSFDVSDLQVALAERHSEMSQTSKSGIPVVLPYPQKRSMEAIDSNTLQSAREALLCGSDSAVQSCFKPECIRLAPPLHAFDDELVWMNPSNPAEHTVAWDMSMCVSNTAGVEEKCLMAKAFKSSLTSLEEQKLLQDLENDPKLIYHVGLPLSKITDLVENNPKIAYDVLVRLQHSSQINVCYGILVNMQMSFHSMEVINRLITTFTMPVETIHVYISNCIRTCKGIKDKSLQNRCVRLVCVFLQSLIKGKTIYVRELEQIWNQAEFQNICSAFQDSLNSTDSYNRTSLLAIWKALIYEHQDFFIEVQAFCIEFNHIREAAALFELLKQIDNCEQIPPQVIPNHQQL